MRKKPLVSTPQLVLITVGSALLFPYTLMPILMSPPANQDVWIVLLLSVVYIIIISAPMLFIINKFKGYSAVQAIEVLFGKLLGKTVAVIYVLFFILYSVICMMAMEQFVNIFLLPETPIWSVAFFLAIPSAYMSYKGAGTIGRTAPFFVILLMFTIVFYFAFSINKMDPKELMPAISDSTFLKLNLGAFYNAASFPETLIFFIFSFYLSKKVSVLKTYYVGLGVFFICYMLILLPTILVLGDEYARHAFSPYFIFARQVEVFGFLTRVQTFYVIALIPIAILKLTIYNYMAGSVINDVVGAKTHKYFVIPLAFVPFAACFVPLMRKTGTLEFLITDRFSLFITIPVVFVLPLIMLIVYLFRRKKINAALKLKLSAQEASN